jgi:hypothetical protein
MARRINHATVPIQNVESAARIASIHFFDPNGLLTISMTAAPTNNIRPEIIRA